MSGGHERDDTDLTPEEFERRISTSLPAQVYPSKDAWLLGRNEEANSLRSGIYTVREVCNVLRPSMTRRKVSYWLKQGMLGEPVAWGAPGYPALLSFEQVLRVRTLQRIRDDLKFSLKRARQALDWIIENLVADEGWREMHFFRATKTAVGVTDGSLTVHIPTGQGVLDATIPELDNFIQGIRRQWEEGFLRIEGFSLIVSDPAIMAGSPVISGTRVETAFIANLAAEEGLAKIKALFPKIDERAIREAAEFENVELVA